MQRPAPAASSAGPIDRILSLLRPDAARMRVLRGLYPFVWPVDRRDLQRTVLLSLGLMLVAKLVTVLTPYAFKWATDALVAVSAGKAPPAGTTFWLIATPVGATLLYGIARIAMTGLMQVREGLFAKVAMHAVRKMALGAFEHMHRLSLRFHLERKTGGLTRVLERGRDGIEQLTRMTLMTFLPTVVELALVLAVCAIEFDWRYIVTIVVMVVLYLWFTFWATEWRMAIRKTMNESDTEANTKAVDSLLNYETVKYFGAEQREAARYDKSLIVYERASINTYISLAVLNTGQGVIFTAGLTTCLAMSALDVMSGHNTVGHFAMVNLLFLQLFIPLNFMGTMYREIKQSLLDIERMMDILEQNPEIADKPDATPLKVSGGTIRFDNVAFRYETDRPILKGLSFEVPAGKMVAVVGPSGAGKSTISRILMRFYDISGGKVTIDGQDIRDVTQTSLRAAMGVVPQDTVLFNDNIRYNIHYGRHDATVAEVEEAARMAQIDTFIKLLPEGYETMVGERGLKLSGGEKQRVAIARTILKAPPILILDEATSALDSHTEKEIQDALDRVAKDRTTLVAYSFDEGVVGGLSHGGAEARGREVGKRSVIDDDMILTGIATVTGAADKDTFCFANFFRDCGGFLHEGKEVGPLAGLYAIHGDRGKRGGGTVRRGVPARFLLVSDDLGG